MASGMLRSPGYCWVCAGDRYASDPPMLTVPAAADEMPVPDPVDAVLIETAGHCFLISAVQRLNRGYSRLDPVSCRAAELVGQFSRLWSDAAAAVVAVDALVVVVAAGVELHAARTTVDASTTESTATPCMRLVRRLEVPRVGAAEGRVDMAGEAPVDWDDRGALEETVMPTG